MVIGRDLNGSYGAIAIDYDSQDLLVFDDIDYTYESGVNLGLINDDERYGWKDRTIFVANAGLDNIEFDAVFTAAQSGLGVSAIAFTIAFLLN